jgi:hypothetical protein
MFCLKSICRLILITSAFSLISYPVKAALINFNAQGNITAIQKLQIGNNSYNVEFVQDTFSNLFGSLSNLTLLPTFWLDAEGANTARSAIDSVLETHYPSLIASDETQSTTNYIIPEQSALSLRIIDDQGNISYPTTVFGGLWGNYDGYYQNRQFNEFVERIYQSGGICSCVFTPTFNPEIYSGTDINSPRTFAIFSPNQNELIPEPSNIIGLTVIGISALLIGRKI